MMPEVMTRRCEVGEGNALYPAKRKDHRQLRSANRWRTMK